MDAPTMGLALLALVVICGLAWRRWRTRSDQRLQWQGTRERDWSADELDALRSSDVAA